VIDAVEIGPDARRVVAELMRRELEISTATVNRSARRLPQQADVGGLSKEIVVPFRSSLLRPIRNRQSAHIKTGNRKGKGRQMSRGGRRSTSFRPGRSGNPTDGPSDLPAIEAESPFLAEVIRRDFSAPRELDIFCL
jgi:hypothetical protein